MPTLPTPVLYRAVELLTIAPSSTDSSARTETLQTATTGPAGVHGGIVPNAPDIATPESRQLTWTCRTRAELAALEAFLGRRMGRRTPFWCPTFRQDARVTASGTSSWTIERTDYVDAFDRLADERNGADYWVAISLTGTMIPARVTAVADGGATAVLTLSPSIAAAGTSAQGVIFSRLELVRLVDDAITTTYLTGSVATVAASVVSIPREIAT